MHHPCSRRTVNAVARLLALALLLTVIAARSAGAEDRITVTFDASLREAPATGRLILLFARAAAGADPLDAPFWNDPQPICSIAVENVKPGAAMVIGDVDASFPGPMSFFDGAFRVRAVLDVDRTTGGFLNSADNLLSEPVELTFRAGEEDRHEITLTGRMPALAVEDTDRVKEVVWRSERLSAFHGRDVFLRAGVVLPESYEAQGDRRFAAIYRVPGFGGRHYEAWDRPGRDGPLDGQVLNVYLDPDGPNSHHLFVNSECNGPVGDALVYELIPHLEERFRLARRPEARLLTGHSSGGFSTAWLQVNYPTFFGGCWSTGPDPVDFRAFQVINVYEDENAYVDASGADRPSVIINGQTVCTIRQENGMEYAIDPEGGAGQQWSSWMACFSKRDALGFPVPLWNMKTGVIGASLREQWKQRDLRHILESRWEEIGPLMSERLRIICGEADNFSLHEAVRLLRDSLEQLPGWRSEWPTTEERATHGYITLIPGATHMNLHMYGVQRRIAAEMLEHLKRHGLAE